MQQVTVFLPMIRFERCGGGNRSRLGTVYGAWGVEFAPADLFAANPRSAKASALRINLNIDGCGAVATIATLFAHNLPVPGVYLCTSRWPDH